MPWHPKFLKGVYSLMLRRNLGRGRVLGGLELPWGLVPDILHALCALGRWRLDGSVGPMHKWYGPHAFDVMSHEGIMTQRAVAADAATLHGARAGEDLLSAGFDVRCPGEGAEDDAAAASADADAEVEEAVYGR